MTRPALRPTESAALVAAVLAFGPLAFTPAARPALALALAAGAAWAAFLED